MEQNYITIVNCDDSMKCIIKNRMILKDCERFIFQRAYSKIQWMKDAFSILSNKTSLFYLKNIINCIIYFCYFSYFSGFSHFVESSSSRIIGFYIFASHSLHIYN